MKTNYDETMSKGEGAFNSETQVKRGAHRARRVGTVRETGAKRPMPLWLRKELQGMLHRGEPISSTGPITNGDF